jgi:hypothetical protein
MSQAAYEPLVGVIRIFDSLNSDEGCRPPRKYQWCATVVWTDGECVELVGVTKAPTASEARVLVRQLRDLGAKRIVVRKKDGRVTTHFLEKDVSDVEKRENSEGQTKDQQKIAC